MSDTMSYHEAAELGRRIHDEHPDVCVVAVGRFLPPNELQSKPERWGVSVILPGGRRSVCWSSMAFAMLVTPPAKTPKRSKAAPKRKQADERQAVLF